MKKSLLALRVHIAAVGFEIDRVVYPLTQLKADKVWLIVEEEVEQGEASYHYQTVKNELKKNNISFDEKRGDIYSLFELLNVYRAIIEDEEPGNQIFINISTGTKIQAIAGMMACMIFKDKDKRITPYYVKPEKYVIKPRKGEQLTSGFKDVIPLPNYKIERPSNKLVKALQIVKDNGPISKKILIEKLTEYKLIAVGTNIQHQESAKHSQLNKNFIEPLISWGFINISGRGKSSRIEITQDGENILKFLHQ